MAITLGELERDVLELLQKEPGHQGYYTEQKCRAALQDCFDFVSTMMFDAQYGGWLDKLQYLDTTDGQVTVDLPKDMAQLKVVRYKIEGNYIPLGYDKQEREMQTTEDSVDSGIPSRYRLVGNQIYFNPPIQDGGTNYLQLEFTAYPERFVSRLDKIGEAWNAAFRHFIKYRTATVLVSHKRDFNPPWAKLEQQWQFEVRKMISQRVITSGTIKEVYP